MTPTALVDVAGADGADDADDAAIDRPAGDGGGTGGPGGARDQPRGWGWLTVRITAVVLAVGVPVHVIGTFVLTDPARVTSIEQLARWGSPGWRLFDWALVVLGLVHGAVALRPVIAGWSAAPAVRAVVGSVLWVAVAVSGALVTFAAATVPFR